MRAASGLVFLSVSLLLFMLYLAGRQELVIRTFLLRIGRAKEQVQVKENEIVALRLKLQNVNGELGTLKTSEAELTKQEEDAKKSKSESEAVLQSCTKEKEDNEKKKQEMADVLSKLKESQEAEKMKAHEEVQRLKQQILDRDKAICVFVDPQMEEGKKLCGM